MSEGNWRLINHPQIRQLAIPFFLSIRSIALKPEERVNWVYNSKSDSELAGRYQEWAKTYEQDMVRDFGYLSPEIVSDYVSKVVSTHAHILDAGSGTGLVGQLLYNQGYRRLVAMDLSEEMLARAQKKDIYTDLRQGVLGQVLEFADDEFDAVVSAGVFTVGHAPASGFDELIRVTKPGGHIIFTLHSDLYERGEFPDKLAALVAAGAWSLVEVSDKLCPTPIGEPDVTVRVLVYRVED
jgi:SAM-dependent methyltransferase